MHKLYNARYVAEVNCMQQNLICPGCGSTINANQRYCGICGTKLFDSKPMVGVLTCPNCGSPLAEGQQFCGVCGSKVAIPDVVPAMEKYAPGSPDAEVALVSNEKDKVSGQEKRKALVGYKDQVRDYGLFNAGGAVFLSLGWIILILGCLASIALIVLAAMGGGFRLLFGDFNILGTPAIIIGSVGFVLSLITGFEFLVIGRLCYALNDLRS